MKLLCCFIFLAGVAMASKNGDIDGAKVITAVPKHVRQIEFLMKLHDSGEYDFWTKVSRIGGKVEILATKSQLTVLTNLLRYNRIDYSIKIEDVGQLINESQLINEAVKDKSGLVGISMEWTNYYTLDEIYAWMEEQAVAYPGLVTVTNIGKSYEGRDIKLMKISTGGENKPIIFSEATIHAREWLAPATLTWIINELLTNQTEYASSLAEVDFHFVVVSNPDGYAYSWESRLNRLWRKTRQPYEYDCYGADPNRNFDFQFAVGSASANPCSEVFHGPYPYSENCTKVLTDQIMSNANNTRVYLGFHSYAEEWLRPWGYQSSETEDGADLTALCETAVDSLAEVNGVEYKCVLGGLNFQAGGVSDDWAYEIARIKYSYTIELRDQGFGFLIPPEHIIPSGQEVFAAFRVIFEYIRDNPNDTRT